MPKKQKKKPISPFARALGARLRAARRAAGIKLDELGERLGVTGQQIQNYEIGGSRLYDESICKACEALSITPHDLLGWNEKFRPETKALFFVLGDRHRRLIVTDYDGLFEAGFASGQGLGELKLRSGSRLKGSWSVTPPSHHRLRSSGLRSGAPWSTIDFAAIFRVAG